MRVDDPAESVVHGEALPRLHPALGLDEIVEAALFAKAAGVDPDRRDPHLVGQIDAVQCVVDVLLAHVGIVVDKVLVNREVVEVEAQGEGAAFELLQVGVLLRFHLAVEDFHARSAPVRRRRRERFRSGSSLV